MVEGGPFSHVDPFDPLRIIFSHASISAAMFYFSWIWLICEVLFFVLVRFVLAPYLNIVKKPPAQKDPLKLMTRVLDAIDELKSYSIEKFIFGFFLESSVSDLKTENVKSFFAWSMCAKKVQDLTLGEERQIDSIFADAQRRHECLRNVPFGFNPAVKHVEMTLCPTVSFIHRPLFMNVISGLLECFANFFVFRAQGYRSLELRGITYKYLKGKRNDLEPMLFLHGITSGWMIYMQLIKALSGDRTIILIDLNSIKIKSLSFNMPRPQDFSDTIFCILKRHNFSQASVVGHSFGSITAGWFVSCYPQAVSHLTLLDPVSLLLALPEVAFSFLYKKPRTVMEWCIYLFAAQELTIANTLYRSFWWYENILWLEDVPAHVGIVVALAGGGECVYCVCFI